MMTDPRHFPTPEIGDAVRLVEAGAPARSGLLCPVCCGGRTGERSVSVYQSATCVKASCKRASCGWWQKFPRIGGPVMELPEDAKARPNPYTRALEPVRGELRRYLHQKYRLCMGTIAAHIRHAAEEAHQPSIYMPVRDVFGRIRGGMLKRLGVTGRKKTLAFCEDRKAPFIAWYLPELPEPASVVIVEDQLSAMRVAQLGHAAVALLGTTVDNDRWREIRGYAWLYRVESIQIALDRDAFPQSIRIARRYCGTTPIAVRVLLLDADFKDAEDSEILEKLR